MRRRLLGLVLAAWSCAGCGEDPRPPPSPTLGTAGSAGVGGGAGVGIVTAGTAPILIGGPTPLGPEPTVDLGAECDSSRRVDGTGEALLVRDPEILERFSLERVLARMIDTVLAPTTPLEALQRLFDTENSAASAVFAGNVHCDDLLNPVFGEHPAVDCPRAEGALARSQGLLSADDPDGFVPIALVNRFDLLPSNVSTCGRYDIVYAKRSGASDPSQRLLLNFQAILPNPGGTLASCRPVVELWAGLELDDDVSSRADALEAFFFEGVGGFAAVVDPGNYGLSSPDCDAPVPCGQIQVGQGMQEPWQFRQFRPHLRGAGPELYFMPTPLQGMPRPELFDSSLSDPYGPGFRSQLVGNVPNLANWDVPRLAFYSSSIYEMGESAVSGAASPSYLTRVNESPLGAELRAALEAAIPPESADGCPAEDPLDANALLQRVTALSCAGCHAPDRTIVPERGIGCGQAWPASLGVSHIDEHGQLSEALTQVFLPHRAELLTLFLQACDGAAVLSALGVSLPVPQGGGPIPVPP